MIWWLWPHFKRIWTVIGAIAMGFAINYFYGLWGRQSVPDLRRLADFFYSYWYWTGGALTLLAVASILAERAHRRHTTPHFIGENRGRKDAKLEPLPTSIVTGSTLLVGRDDELQRLDDWFASVLQGERRVVFVTGEAGIGKTTFLNAFLDSLRRKGVRIARGQCVEQYGAGEPFMPMLEALTQLGRSAENQQLLAILHRLAPAWLVQLPALLTAEERALIQRETHGLTEPRMLREMAETLTALAAEKPLVILLEDLHWSDVSTLDLIATIARRREPARLLMLGTYRQVEMLAGDHRLRAMKEELELHQQCLELRLTPLNEENIAAYLKMRFANDGAARFRGLAPAIYQRSEGNPLFMINLVDYLAAQEPQLDPDKLEIPRNVRQMIERNLRRLDPSEQSMLESAGVAGTEFSAGAVAAALQRPVNEVEACCTRLARNEQFIHAQGTVRWPDGTASESYRFLHALYQEVLYERTPTSQRTELHRRIAECEETAYGEQAGEIAAKLANHFSRANDDKKAVKYFQLASARAVASRLDVLERLLREEDGDQSPAPKQRDDH